MAVGAEVRREDSVHLHKSLGVPSGFKPSHSPLSLTRRLMGVLSPVVQVPMLSMSNAGHHDPFRRPVAAQFVGNDHAWSTSRGTQQLAEKSDGCESVALRLDENINDDTCLIDCAP